MFRGLLHDIHQLSKEVEKHIAVLEEKAEDRGDGRSKEDAIHKLLTERLLFSVFLCANMTCVMVTIIFGIALGGLLGQLLFGG